MDMIRLLALIDARLAETGMSERQASINATGSPDTIRNWRRRDPASGTAGANMNKVTLVCEALGIDLAEVTGATAPARGMAEDASPAFLPFMLRDPIIAALAPNSRTPEIFTSNRDLPAFAIRIGDRLLADMGRTPNSGDIVVASQIDQADGFSHRMICRWLPPYVLPGGISDQLIAVEDGGRIVVARGVVVASWRTDHNPGDPRDPDPGR